MNPPRPVYAFVIFGAAGCANCAKKMNCGIVMKFTLERKKKNVPTLRIWVSRCRKCLTYMKFCYNARHHVAKNGDTGKALLREKCTTTTPQFSRKTVFLADERGG
jgi:hypothetical protein